MITNPKFPKIQKKPLNNYTSIGCVALAALEGRKRTRRRIPRLQNSDFDCLRTEIHPAMAVLFSVFIAFSMLVFLNLVTGPLQSDISIVATHPTSPEPKRRTKNSNISNNQNIYREIVWYVAVFGYLVNFHYVGSNSWRQHVIERWCQKRVSIVDLIW